MSASPIGSADLEFPRRWYPVELSMTGDTPLICWRFLGDQRFTHPLFESTLASVPKEPRLTRRTLPEALAQFSRGDSLEPAAFIFHASRSGSTLVMQLLATLSQCIVISEAPVIDSTLTLCRNKVTYEQGLEILQGIVRALGQRRREDERHLFIKLDSWHITHLPLIRKAFPETPCYFIYRQPAEILASHRRMRGSQMVPGLVDPAALGVDWEFADPADLDGYCLRVLESFFNSALVYARTVELHLINYHDLPALIWTNFLPGLSIPLSATNRLLMEARALQDSKHPRDSFVSIRHQATDVASESRDSTLARMSYLYKELEQAK